MLLLAIPPLHWISNTTTTTFQNSLRSPSIVSKCLSFESLCMYSLLHPATLFIHIMYQTKALTPYCPNKPLQNKFHPLTPLFIPYPSHMKRSKTCMTTTFTNLTKSIVQTPCVISVAMIVSSMALNSVPILFDPTAIQLLWLNLLHSSSTHWMWNILLALHIQTIHATLWWGKVLNLPQQPLNISPKASKSKWVTKVLCALQI